MVATPEVAKQIGGQPVNLVLRHAHNPADHLARPRLSALQLRAGQEEPRDDAGQIGVQPRLNAVRYHRGSLIWGPLVWGPPTQGWLAQGWPIRRACCPVASTARVDSAPWLRLQPCRSRPS